MEYRLQCKSKKTKSMYANREVYCDCMKELNKICNTIFGEEWTNIRYNKFFDYHGKKYKEYHYNKRKNDIDNLYQSYMDNS